METIRFVVSSSAHLEPVAAGPPGEKAQPSWLLELGAAVREAEAKALFQAGRGLRVRSWSSRRAGARARRELVQQALAASAAGSGLEPGEDPSELAIDLLDRVGAYTSPAHVKSH